MTTLTSVQEQALGLTTADKKRLLATLQHEVSKSATKKESPDNPNLALFYAELTLLLKQQLGTKAPPLKVAMADKTLGGALVKCNQFVDDYLNDIKDDVRITKMLRIWFYGMYFNLMSKACRRRNIPVAATTLLRHHKHFPDELNNAYPGYIQSGLFFKVFASVTTKKQKTDAA